MNMSSDNILTRSLPAWLDYDENKKEMVVVPERALIIKRIYNEYLGGKGIDSIVKDLNKDKVKRRPSGVEKDSHRRKISLLENFGAHQQ